MHHDVPADQDLAVADQGLDRGRGVEHREGALERRTAREDTALLGDERRLSPQALRDGRPRRDVAADELVRGRLGPHLDPQVFTQRTTDEVVQRSLEVGVGHGGRSGGAGSAERL
ncbi:MAG: hypothetical protein AAGB93_13000 [Planctomycetota bacterium]